MCVCVYIYIYIYIYICTYISHIVYTKHVRSPASKGQARPRATGARQSRRGARERRKLAAQAWPWKVSEYF